MKHVNVRELHLRPSFKLFGRSRKQLFVTDNDCRFSESIANDKEGKKEGHLALYIYR